MARLQNHIRNITSRKNISAEKRLNLIYGEQIQFDKIKKETKVLSNTLPAEAAAAPPPPTPSILPKVQAEKGFGSNIASEENEEYLKEEEDFEEEPVIGSGLLPHLKTVIKWNIDGLYHTKARRLLKRITENKDILDRNEAGEALVYGEPIPVSNFKSLFTSMVSRRQDFLQVSIDEFHRTQRSFCIKKDDLSCKTLKYKYITDALYKVHHHSSHAPKKKESSSSANSLFQGGKGHVHKPPGRYPNILMFINVIIKLSLIILFYFIISF